MTKLGYKNKKRKNVAPIISFLNTSTENYSYNHTSVLTVCAHCHKVKLDEMNWVDRSSTLSNNIDEEVSHGICPSCMTLLYPDIADDIIVKMLEAD